MEGYCTVSVQQNYCQFQKTIRQVENTYLRDITNKRQALQIKNKLRSEWINRKKIIPVHYKFQQKNKTIETKARLFDYRKYPQVQSKRSAQDIFEQFLQNKIFAKGQIKNQVPHQKNERYSVMNATTGDMKATKTQLRIRKKKINWKLQYRKDEINVLKYLSTSQSPSYPNINQCLRYHSNYLQNVQNDSNKLTPPKILYRKLKCDQQNDKKNSQKEINKQTNSKKRQGKKGRTSVLIRYY